MQSKDFPKTELSHSIFLKLFAFPLFVLVPFTIIMVTLWDYLLVSQSTLFHWDRFLHYITLSKNFPFTNIKVTPLVAILVTDFISFIIYCWHIRPIFHYLKTGEQAAKAEYSIYSGFNKFFWLGFIVLAYLYGTFFTEEIVDLGDEKIVYLLFNQLFCALIWSIFVICCMMVIRLSCAPVIRLINRTSIHYKNTLFLDTILPFLPAAFFIGGVSLIYYRSMKFLFHYGQVPNTPPMPTQSLYIALFLLMFLLMILGFNFLVRAVESQERSPIQRELDNLAQGKADLTQRLFIPSLNNRGVFVSDFNKFLEKFHRQTLRLKHSVLEIGQGVGALKKNFAKISESEEIQKREIDPVGSSVSRISKGMGNLIGEVKEKYEYISDNLRHIDEIALGIEEIITFFQGIKKQSFNSLSTANVVMKQIKESMEKSAQMTESMALISKKIQEAGKEAEHIDEILILIQDISEQTNILSINAAIEAAHAGDDGKGFAIVANEVRTLATESGKAVEHISKKLLDIQLIIRSSVEMTLSAEQITKENSDLVIESYTLINSMIEQFHKTGRITENTAAIISQQGDITRSFHKQVRSLMLFFENLRNTMISQESSFEELHGTLEGLQESFASVSSYNKMVEGSIEHVSRTEERLSGMVNVFKTE